MGCWNTDGLEGNLTRCEFIILQTSREIKVRLRREHGGILPLVWNQDVVDSSQFDVDLEAEVGQRLRGRLHHVLHLDALGGHAEEGVSHPLHLSCRGHDACDQHYRSFPSYPPHSLEFQVLTVNRRFPRQDDHDQLQADIRHLEVFEHGLHAVGSLGVFTEAWLALNWHSSIL